MYTSYLYHSAIAMLSLPVSTAASPISTTRPKALIYRGPVACDGCPESVAALLTNSPYNFDVRFTGPKESVDLSPATLNGVEVYAFPGGPDLDKAYKAMKKHKTELQNFVSSGGHYLGFCLGAYLASPLDLLPSGMSVGSEIEQSTSQVRDARDTVIQVDWTFGNGTTSNKRWLYFQEGAVMTGVEEAGGKVLARYSANGDVAASVSRFGKGWVGLVGPHPEADESWYEDAGISNPDGVNFDFGYDFIEATMSGRTG